MAHHAGRALVVATYNILADENVRPEYYPRCSLDDFRPDVRHPRLLARTAGFGADAICLQEVTSEMFARLEGALGPRGYRGVWARKTVGKPHGCATFFRAPIVCTGQRTVAFSDGGMEPASGRVALVLRLDVFEQALHLVNTHLEWDPPETPDAERRGLAQAQELVSALDGLTPTIICMDANVRPDDAVIRVFRQAGYDDAHEPAAATFIAKEVPQKLDYALHSADLAAKPLPTPALTGETPLPSAKEPSDHLPLIAAFTFA